MGVDLFLTETFLAGAFLAATFFAGDFLTTTFLAEAFFVAGDLVLVGVALTFFVSAFFGIH